ncbi:hypothetical protein HK104_009449 [Borealophlyctis nickersoniae]|nr:hypothetical protein HK104_009449 [Borealophlyctis nickersoniae]
MALLSTTATLASLYALARHVTISRTVTLPATQVDPYPTHKIRAATNRAAAKRMVHILADPEERCAVFNKREECIATGERWCVVEVLKGVKADRDKAGGVERLAYTLDHVTGTQPFYKTLLSLVGHTQPPSLPTREIHTFHPPIHSETRTKDLPGRWVGVVTEEFTHRGATVTVEYTVSDAEGKVDVAAEVVVEGPVDAVVMLARRVPREVAGWVRCVKEDTERKG